MGRRWLWGSALLGTVGLWTGPVSAADEKYVYASVDGQAVSVMMVDPDDPASALDLAAGLPGFPYPSIPFRGISCSPTGKHVVIAGDQGFYLATGDGAVIPLKLSLAPASMLVPPALSDDGTRLAHWNVDSIAIVTLPGEATVASFPGPHDAAAMLMLSPDGRKLLASRSVASGASLSTFSAELPAPSIEGHYVDIEGGTVRLLLDKAITRDTGAGLQHARVSTGAASFLPDGIEAVFFSDEAFLLEYKTAAESPGYTINQEVSANELYRATPGGSSALPLTVASKSALGDLRQWAVVSPAGDRVLFWGGLPNGWELLVVDLGSALPVPAVKGVFKQPAGACWLSASAGAGSTSAGGSTSGGAPPPGEKATDDDGCSYGRASPRRTAWALLALAASAAGLRRRRPRAPAHT